MDGHRHIYEHACSGYKNVHLNAKCQGGECGQEKVALFRDKYVIFTLCVGLFLLLFSRFDSIVVFPLFIFIVIIID